MEHEKTRSEAESADAKALLRKEGTEKVDNVSEEQAEKLGHKLIKEVKKKNADPDKISAHISGGANLEVYDFYGKTALMHASKNGHRKIVDALMCKANINMQDDYGFTALIHASRSGHSEIVKALIEGNANMDMQDCGGGTALLWAVARSHKEVIKALLESGADADLKNNNGVSARKFSRENNDEEIRALFHTK